jgi:hypothetical protein
MPVLEIVPEHGDARRLGRNLQQDFKPLRAQFGSQQRPQDKHGLRDLFFRKEK